MIGSKCVLTWGLHVPQRNTRAFGGGSLCFSTLSILYPVDFKPLLSITRPKNLRHISSSWYLLLVTISSVEPHVPSRIPRDRAKDVSSEVVSHFSMPLFAHPGKRSRSREEGLDHSLEVSRVTDAI